MQCYNVSNCFEERILSIMKKLLFTIKILPILKQIRTLFLLGIFVSLLTFPFSNSKSPAPVQADIPPNPECVGKELARYVCTVFEDLQIPEGSAQNSLNHVRFLTPAWNLTDPGNAELVQFFSEGLVECGYSLDNFYAVAGNAYNIYSNGSLTAPISQWISNARATAIGQRQILLTETGWYPHGANDPRPGSYITDLQTQISAFDANMLGGLIFNVFGNNPSSSFSGQIMQPGEIDTICGGHGNCGNAKVGANSASFYNLGADFYNTAAGYGMPFSLAIAQSNNPGDLQSDIAEAHNRSIAPVIRLGVMDESYGFDNPSDLASFVQALDNSVGNTVYVILGPNEPLTELWATPNCEIPSCKFSISPTKMGQSLLSDIEDPDCPDKKVSPSIKPTPFFTCGYPEEPIAPPQTCYVFTKKPSQWCFEVTNLGTDSVDVSYTFTITTQGCSQALTNITITDSVLGFSETIDILNPGETYSQTVNTTLTTDLQNTATMTALYGSEQINVSSKATVRVREIDGCQGCQISGVDFLCQRDPAFNTDCAALCDASGGKGMVAEYGCGITSISMISRFIDPPNYPVGQPDDPADPGKICPIFGTMIHCGSQMHYLGQNMNVTYASCSTPMEYFEQVSDLVCTYNQPIMANIVRNGFNHFLVITGVDITAGEVTVNDPWYGCDATGAGGPLTFTFDQFFPWAAGASCRLHHYY